MNTTWRTRERIEEIKKKRCSAGYFTGNDMVRMLEKHGIKMSRQTYQWKEYGRFKFSVEQLQALADEFKMSMEEATRFFND